MNNKKSFCYTYEKFELDWENVADEYDSGLSSLWAAIRCDLRLWKDEYYFVIKMYKKDWILLFDIQCANVPKWRFHLQTKLMHS